jgi:hypothetical protein
VSEHGEEVEELLDRAEGLDEGPAKVALLEEAVRLADTHGDVEEGYRARQVLIRAATFGGLPDRALVAFSWCLAQSDREPESFPVGELLWEYKWVVGHIYEFPQVGLGQIESMMGDMARRYAEAGSTLRAIHTKGRQLAIHRGDRRSAAREHRALHSVPRDWLSDCPACERDADVEYLAWCGKDSEALEHAGPILKGYYTCAEVPQRTYARILLPLVRLGRVEEAMAWHVKGYRMIARNPNFLTYVADHLTFLVLTDNLARGVKLLEKHLGDALATPAMSWRFDFYLASRLLLERLREQGQETLKLRLPKYFPLHHAEGRYSVKELEGWFAGQLKELAGRFDARNGTKAFARKMREHRRLRGLVSPCPLPGRAG